MKYLNSFQFFLFLPFLSAFNFNFSQSYCVSNSELHGNLHVEDGNIVNQNGQIISFAGNSFDLSATGSGDEDFYNSDVVSWLKQDWNTTIVRAVVAVEQPGGYLDNPQDNIERVQRVVDAAIAENLYVIVDWHSQHAENYLSDAISFFEDIAQQYGNYPNIIYEIYGEPLNTSWSNSIKPYAEAVITAIRRIDPDNLIVVGTPNRSQDVDIASIDPITISSNIIYALQFHAASHGQFLRDKAQIAINNGIVLVVTEWSAVYADDTGQKNEIATMQWMNFLSANDITHTHWAISDADIVGEGASILTPGADPNGGWAGNDLSDNGRFIKGIIEQWTSSHCPEEGNIPPTVFIGYPEEGDQLSLGRHVFYANANNSNGDNPVVEFFINGMSIGSDTNDVSQLYLVEWNVNTEGSYILTAVATDGEGLSTISEAVEFTVSEEGNNEDENHPTLLSVINPDLSLSGLPSVNEGEIFSIEVKAFNPGGVESIEFFIDGESIGIDSTPPYTAEWVATGIGDHRFSVESVDGNSVEGGFYVHPCNGITEVVQLRLVYPVFESTVYAGQTINAIAEGYITNNGDFAEGQHIEFYVDDEFIGSDTTLPYTAQWTPANPGNYFLRVYNEDGDFTSHSITVLEPDTNAYPQGVPHVIPGIINATHFDNGGQGNAYSDTDMGNNGNGPRQNENVDTGNNGGEGLVGWIEPGEWLNYTAVVGMERGYNFEFEVASESGNSQFHIEIDGADITGPVYVPATGSWNNYTTVEALNIPLSEGLQTIRIVFDQGPFNLRNINISFSENYYCGGDYNNNNTPICSFDTPISTPLFTHYATYNTIYVIGNGPDLSNVVSTTIGWDLQNNGLNQLSFNTDDGFPDWWIDLRNYSSHNFNRSQPDITFSNTGIPGFDGEYWVALDGYNLALVSKNNRFTIYFSNSSSVPSCSSTSNRMAHTDQETIEESMSVNDVSVYPNPSTSILIIDFKNNIKFDNLFVVDIMGRTVHTQKIQGNRMSIPVSSFKQGIYIIKLVANDKLVEKKFIKN